MSEKMLYDEQVIKAEEVICKLKKAAAEFDSTNPKHKNGKKYFMSRKKYEHILRFELSPLPEDKRVSITAIIKRKILEI